MAFKPVPIRGQRRTSSIWVVVTPAATETTTAPSFRAALKLATAVATNIGFTASTTISAPATASALSRVQRAPVARTASDGPEGDERATRSAEMVPLASAPFRIALAIFPAPTKARRRPEGRLVCEDMLTKVSRLFNWGIDGLLNGVNTVRYLYEP